MHSLTLAATVVTQLLFWRNGSRPLAGAVVRTAAVLFVAALFVAATSATYAERQRERGDNERLREEKAMLLVNARSASERAAALDSQVRELQSELSQIAPQCISPRASPVQEASPKPPAQP